MNAPPTDADDADLPVPDHDEVFVAIVSTGAGGSKVCSISPLPGMGRTAVSEWVLARDDSFVSLDEMR